MDQGHRKHGAGFGYGSRGGAFRNTSMKSGNVFMAVLSSNCLKRSYTAPTCTQEHVHGLHTISRR